MKDNFTDFERAELYKKLYEQAMKGRTTAIIISFIAMSPKKQRVQAGTLRISLTGSHSQKSRLTSLTHSNAKRRCEEEKIYVQ